MGSMVIGIGGGTNAGKTTFSSRLKAAFGDRIATLSHDSYYRRQDGRSLEERRNVNYDSPESLETELLVAHIRALKNGEAVDVPVYDFTVHNRTQAVRHVLPSRVILVEGNLVLHEPSLRELLDIKVYVEADADERIIRRVLRDMRERGRSMESVFHQYLTTVKPMHALYIEPTRASADIILNSGMNDVAFDLFRTKIQAVLDETEEDAPERSR